MELNGVAVDKYAIVFSENSGESVRTAARELQAYFHKRTGILLPFAEKAALYSIFLGEISAADSEKVRHGDGFILKKEPNGLRIAGKEEVGTLYGVYYFLEKYLGVRYLAPGCEYLPKTDLDIQVEDEAYDFAARMRICHSFAWRDQAFRARKRMTYTVGDTNDLPAYGGVRGMKYAFSWGLYGHTFRVLLPFERYYLQHKDWFSFAESHEGESAFYQLCLSNPEVVDEVTNNALAYLRKHPDCQIISVSQNDSWGEQENNYCRCPTCRALAKKYKTQSGVMLRFVNEVARRIGKEFPNVYVHTLAYTYTKEPPEGIRAEDNVIVQYCMQIPQGSSLRDSEGSQAERSRLEKWSKLTDNLFVWTYICEHSRYFPPIGNFKAIYDNTSFLLDMGVKGFFQQEIGDKFCGEFSYLRCYLTAELFNAPKMTYEEYEGKIAEFCRHYYGDGEYIPAYIRLLEEKFASYPNTNDEETLLRFYGEKEFVESALLLYALAEGTPKTQAQALHLKANRLNVDFCALANAYIQGDKDYAEKRKRFLTAAKEAGVVFYRENNKLPDFERLDFSTNPFRYTATSKKVVVTEGQTATIYGGDCTKEAKFNFKGTLSYENGRLTITLVVEGENGYCKNENINDWAQDCVEIYVSEQFNRTNALGKGDYKVRVNADGVYGEYLARGKVVSCRAQKTPSGYEVRVTLSLPKSRVGFEIMAHNFTTDGKYDCTRYWNAIKFSDVSNSPQTYGELCVQASKAEHKN